MTAAGCPPSHCKQELALLVLLCLVHLKMLYVSTVGGNSFFFSSLGVAAKVEAVRVIMLIAAFLTPTLYFPETAHEIWRGSFVCFLVGLSARLHAAHRLQEVTLKVEETHRLSVVCVSGCRVCAFRPCVHCQIARRAAQVTCVHVVVCAVTCSACMFLCRLGCTGV